MMMVMKPRPTLRTFCRWMLTILTVMLVVVWIGSRRYDLLFSRYWNSDGRRMTLTANIVYGGFYFSIDRSLHEGEGPSGIDWEVGRDKLFLRYLAISFPERVHSVINMRIPLWLPPLLLAIPTALMWRTHHIAHRRKPGMCKKCGYDITGLVSKGTCPECGTGIKIEVAQASAS
jgi:hypothetical protein